MNVFLALMLEFFKIGLFAIGGGLATLPFLYEIANKYDWLDVSVMSDMIAVSESTPGPIGVNMATYCGYNAGFSEAGVAGGIAGGILSTFALVLPSVIIVIIVSKVLERFKNSTLVDNAFKGLRPAVCGLIAAACYDVFKSACLETELFKESDNLSKLFDIKALILFVILFLLTRKFKKIHPIFIIIPAAIVGILFKM
ncbi:MAG: chromate transporter [Clostridia bacterium]|nr:chromate transporter [Clostridia bacterium]